MSRLGHVSVLIFASLLTIAVNVWAQEPLNQERGFDPTAVYSSGGIDNVDLFGGNLSIAIPLGPRFSVGPTLKYGFTLVYNSHLWDFMEMSCSAPNSSGASSPANGLWAVPNQFANAGLGWMLTFGAL